MELARAAVALPPNQEGDRWRESIVPIIELHAIAMALGEIEELRSDERAVARDRAAVGIRRSAAALGVAWRGVEMPDAIREFEQAAISALEVATWAGARQLSWRGDGTLSTPSLPGVDAVLDGRDRQGSLWVVPPGTPLMPGAPMAWWADREDPALALLSEGGEENLPWSRCAISVVRVPQQLYRVLDHRGHAVEDRLVPLHETLPAGLPLLVPLLDRGRFGGGFPQDLERWAALHIAALSPSGRVPLCESMSADAAGADTAHSDTAHSDTARAPVDG